MVLPWPALYYGDGHTKRLAMIKNQRGFTLLIAILLSTIAVTLGVSLLEVSYKQVILSSTAKQSQYAFYAADSAMECALYYDQQFNAFSYTSPMASGSISCDTRTITNFTNPTSGGNKRITTFTLPCAGTGESAEVIVYKYQDGTTNIYANGYNTCNAGDARRIERGLKVSY